MVEPAGEFDDADGALDQGQRLIGTPRGSQQASQQAKTGRKIAVVGALNRLMDFETLAKRGLSFGSLAERMTYATDGIKPLRHADMSIAETGALNGFGLTEASKCRVAVVALSEQIGQNVEVRDQAGMPLAERPAVKCQSAAVQLDRIVERTQGMTKLSQIGVFLR